MILVGARDLIYSHLNLNKLLYHFLLVVIFAMLRHKQVFLELLFVLFKVPSETFFYIHLRVVSVFQGENASIFMHIIFFLTLLHYLFNFGVVSCLRHLL